MFERSIAVGRRHADVGLAPRWYIGAYSIFLEKLVGVIAERHRARPAMAEEIGAVIRAVFLDMDLALSSYISTGEATRIRSEMLSVAEVLDREVELAVGEIAAQAERLAEGADTLETVSENVRAKAEKLTSSINTTFESVCAVSGATDELEVCGTEISKQLGDASTVTAQAVQEATTTEETVSTLQSATGKITDVVKVVRSIAAQTKLLALNATIEAARAGVAGKGFAVVAGEVKNLARQTEDAIQLVSGQAGAIRAATSESARKVKEIAGHIATIDTIAGGVTAANDRQRQATSSIMSSICVAAAHTQAVSYDADSLLTEADATRETAIQFNRVASMVSRGITDLNRRLSVILRSSQVGNRRSAERVPVSIGFSGRVGAEQLEGHTLDLSLTGALLSARATDGQVGAMLSLRFDRIGDVNAKVVAVSSLGTHARFDAVDAAQLDRIREIHGEVARSDIKFIALCEDMAQQVTTAMESSVANGLIAKDALFDMIYREVPGTDPKQYISGATEFADVVLAPLLDAMKQREGRTVFCLVTDRNGYLPTHNTEYRKPQQPGDPIWNAANCRNRRIFDDRTGILAARNRKPHLIQAYHRDMGGGRRVMLKEYDVPIMIGEEHWGAVRFAVCL
jgi:methyl-accepting chemotaxis protein